MLTEEREDPAVRIAEEQLPRRRYAERIGGRTRLSHAARRQIARLRGAHERALLDKEQIELGGIAARDPHDARAPAGPHDALDEPGATQRLVIRVGRDHQERGVRIDRR
jgi:hypothetical protein